MVNGLKTAIEKPTLVARIDIPRPIRESHPREKASAMIMGTIGMTSSKMPKKAPKGHEEKSDDQHHGILATAKGPYDT